MLRDELFAMGASADESQIKLHFGGDFRDDF